MWLSVCQGSQFVQTQERQEDTDAGKKESNTSHDVTQPIYFVSKTQIHVHGQVLKDILSNISCSIFHQLSHSRTESAIWILAKISSWHLSLRTMQQSFLSQVKHYPTSNQNILPDPKMLSTPSKVILFCHVKTVCSVAYIKVYIYT